MTPRDLACPICGEWIGAVSLACDTAALLVMVDSFIRIHVALGFCIVPQTERLIVNCQQSIEGRKDQ